MARVDIVSASPVSEATDDVSEAVDGFTARTDTPLYVVTIGTADQEFSGCLAGFVTQCSITPSRFLICLSKLNHSFFVGERAIGIGLHLLGETQTDLASLFGEFTGDEVDKFEHCSWQVGSSGAPILSECAAWLGGRVLDRFGVGDHEALLMRPTEGGTGRHRGLLTLRNSPDFQAGHPDTP